MESPHPDEAIGGFGLDSASSDEEEQFNAQPQLQHLYPFTKQFEKEKVATTGTDIEDSEEPGDHANAPHHDNDDGNCNGQRKAGQGGEHQYTLLNQDRDADTEVSGATTETQEDAEDYAAPHAIHTRHGKRKADDEEDADADACCAFPADANQVQTLTTLDSFSYQQERSTTDFQTNQETSDSLLSVEPQTNRQRSSSKQAFTTKGDPVATPGRNDILMGRGKGIADHCGNIIFRNFIREKKQEYNVNSFKYEKGETARQVLEKVASLDPPGRFLKHCIVDGLWHDVSTAKALEKACQALREKKWDHPRQQSGEEEAANGKGNIEPLQGHVMDSEELLVNTVAADAIVRPATTKRKRSELRPGHPNTHISNLDMRTRIRTGARISVVDCETGNIVHNSGKVVKRLAARLQIQTDDGTMVHVDLNSERIRIDSRKLCLNVRKGKSAYDESGDDSDNESDGNIPAMTDGVAPDSAFTDAPAPHGEDDDR